MSTYDHLVYNWSLLSETLYKHSPHNYKYYTLLKSEAALFSVPDNETILAIFVQLFLVGFWCWCINCFHYILGTSYSLLTSCKYVNIPIVSILKKGLCSGLKGTRRYIRPGTKEKQSKIKLWKIDEIEVISKEKKEKTRTIPNFIGAHFHAFWGSYCLQMATRQCEISRRCCSWWLQGIYV